MTVHYARPAPPEKQKYPITPDSMLYSPACGAYKRDPNKAWVTATATKYVTCRACMRTTWFKEAGQTLVDLIKGKVIKSIRPPADVRGQGGDQ